MKAFVIEDCNMVPHSRGVILANDLAEASTMIGVPISSDKSAMPIGGGLRLVECSVFKTREDLERACPQDVLFLFHV